MIRWRPERHRTQPMADDADGSQGVAPVEQVRCALQRLQRLAQQGSGVSLPENFSRDNLANLGKLLDMISQRQVRRRPQTNESRACALGEVDRRGPFGPGHGAEEER